MNDRFLSSYTHSVSFRCTQYGYPALVNAAANGSTDIVKLLLDAEANVDSKGMVRCNDNLDNCSFIRCDL
jgi:ankyrin repeat protein